MAEMLAMHPTVLAKIEKGERAVRIVEAAAIADLFDVSLDSLLGRRDGLANDVADILNGLQHAAGKATLDVGAIHGAIEGWFMELGSLDFDGREALGEAGGQALKALADAQTALYAITQVEAPQRVAVARLDELIERRAAEKIVEMLTKMEKDSETQS